MLKISSRAEQILESPIRKFFPKVLETEKKGIEVFKLNVGDPDLEVPQVFWSGLKKFKSVNLNYAPSQGIAEHARAWVKYYENLGIKLEAKNIIPTVGCAEAILFAMMAVADFGDEIIVFEPLYTSYKGFASMCGITLVGVSLKVENNFALPSADEITKKITPKTRAIVVINPNNPTGAVLSDEEMAVISSLALKYNLFIIADETYREIVFEARPKSFLEFEEIKNNVIALDSISKKFSSPGARIGSIASFSETVMKGILKFAMVRLSAPTLEQYASIPMLEKAGEIIPEVVKEYKKRRDIVFGALSKMSGVITQKPQGALYIMASLPLDNAEDFVKFMISDFEYNKKTVLVTPAEDFYITSGMGKNEIRIAYVLNSDKLKEAMEVLNKGLKVFSKLSNFRISNE